MSKEAWRTKKDRLSVSHEEEAEDNGEEGKMNGATALSPDRAVCEAGMKTTRINVNRVAAWTLIFTNTFFVSYFVAKLLRWV